MELTQALEFLKTLKEKVLVVEKDINAITILKLWVQEKMPLSTADYALNGYEAIDKWRQGEHSIIVMEPMLPKLSGFKVVEKIPEAKMPIVIMTTLNQGAMWREYAKALRVDDYIIKPYHVSRLLISIAEAVGKRNAKFGVAV